MGVEHYRVREEQPLYQEAAAYYVRLMVVILLLNMSALMAVQEVEMELHITIRTVMEPLVRMDILMVQKVKVVLQELLVNLVAHCILAAAVAEV